MAIAAALYAKGERETSIEMAKAALSADKRVADVNYLKKNFWGDRLIADVQKVVSEVEEQ
jgi:hypothetical protein